MPGTLFHLGATAVCPHGAPIHTLPRSTRVLVSGMPVALFTDQYPIVGCAFNVSGGPSPCVEVQWLAPATRVLVNGDPPILNTSAGLCLNPSHAPQGPPTVVTTQPRVVAT
jgi:hypothetical protein